MENSQTPSSDRISNLPHELIVSILTYLPIQDAARTSVLSNFWRDKWHDIPQLVFDDRFQAIMGRSTNLVIETARQIVSSHRRPILKFSLSLGGMLGYPEVNPLINQVLERGPVLNFTFNPPGYERHALPLELYFYQPLTHLNLRGCLFEPPPGFSGFHRLISLVLSDIYITSNVLAHLISNCPQIERLSFEGIDVLGPFEIVAPKLKYLSMRAPLTKVGLVNAPLLTTVLLDRGLPVQARIFIPRKCPDLIGFHCLHVVESLHLDYHCIQGLTTHPFKTPFIHLGVFKLIGFGFVVKDVLSLFSLIENCPNLKKVSIEALYIGDASSVPVQRFYKGLEHCGRFCFDTMREINIVNLAGSLVEMEFIKFLLRRSPVLEQMDLVLDSSADEEDRCWTTLTEFFQIPSLSPSVCITLCGSIEE